MGAAEKGKDKGYSGLGSLTKKQSTYSKPTIINETNSQTKDKKYL